MKYSGLVQQVGLFTILMVILLDLLGLFGPIDSDVRDLQQQHVGRSPSPMSPDIVHVDIDDGALQRIGRWPWPRPLLAACLDELRDAGARTIAIDLELSEPGLDPAADRVLADAIQSDTVLAMLHQDDGLQDRWLESGGTGEGLNTLRELLIQDIDLEPDHATTLENRDREAFAENELAIKRGVLWSYPSLAPQGIAERSIQDAYTQQAESERIAVERGLLDQSDRSEGSSMDRLPVPILLEQAGAVGYVHISRRDSDGSVRSIQPTQTGRSGAATSLGAAAALHFMGLDTHGGSFQEIDGMLAIGDDTRLPLVDGDLPIAWPFTRHGTGWTHLLRHDDDDPVGSGHLSIGTIAELVRGRQLQAENLETMRTLSLELFRFLRQNAELDVENPLSAEVQSEIADEYEFTMEGLTEDSPLEAVFDDADALAHARALRAWKLLSDSIDDGRIEIAELDAALTGLVDDRLVFLGWTATGSIADFVPTVAGSRTPGVVVHAATANMVLTGHAYGYANAWSVVLILLLGIIIVGLVGSTSPLIATVCSLIVVAIYVIAAAILTFSWLDLFVPVAAPATGGLATWITCTSTSAILIQRDKKRITRQFRARVSDRLVDTLIDQPSAISMAGVRREITVLFADLAGFTSASERLDSAEVVALANASLSTLAEQIVMEEGYVNKFLGDGLMAFWSAFEPQTDQAVKACRAASACTAAIARIESTTLGVRLGIATGEAIVGDCGAPPDLNDYTAIGDTVNLAARLESANKIFSSRILIDEETMLQAGDAIRSLPIGPIVVVGRSAVTRVHALVDEDVSDEAIAAATALQRAIEAEDRASAADCLESMGEFAILDTLAERWAEVVDAGEELVMHLSDK